MDYLTPLVYWAQDKTNVYLKVDLKDAQKEKIEYRRRFFTLNCEGRGALGLNMYQLKLELYSDIEPERCSYKIYPNHMEIILYKKGPLSWTRLLEDTCKPFWLRIDFEKWESEENIEEIKNELNKELSYDEFLENTLGDSKMAETISNYLNLLKILTAEKIQPTSIFYYNCIIFINYFILLSTFLIYLRKASKDFSQIYTIYGLRVFIIQFLQCAEIYFSYTKKIPTYWLYPLGNAFNHLVMLQGLCFYQEPRMLNKPIVFYLYLVWSLEACLRYPYYIYKSLYNTQKSTNDAPLLTWMRYTFWLPLCPLQYFVESVALLRMSRYLEEKDFFYGFVIKTNEYLNVSTIIRIYLFVLIIALIFVMATVFENRKRKYGTLKSARLNYMKKQKKHT